MKKNLSKILLKTDSIIRNPVHLIIITNGRSINHSTIHRQVHIRGFHLEN